MYDPKLSARPPVGSSLTRPKFPFTHKGIYVGNLFDGFDQVFENAPGHNEHLTSFTDFAGGQMVSVSRQAPLPIRDLYSRVNAALNSDRKYHPIGNNCDHAESRVAIGVPESMQLLGWVAAAVVVGIVAAGSSKA